MTTKTLKKVNTKIFSDFAIELNKLIPEDKSNSRYNAYFPIKDEETGEIKKGIPVIFKYLKDETTIFKFSNILTECNFDGKDFALIVGYWKEDTEDIVKIETYKIDYKTWSQFYNNDSMKDCEKFLDDTKELRKDIEEEKIDFDRRKNNLKEMWNLKTGGYLQPECKIIKSTKNNAKNLIQVSIKKDVLIAKLKKEVKTITLDDRLKGRLHEFVEAKSKEEEGKKIPQKVKEIERVKVAVKAKRFKAEIPEDVAVLINKEDKPKRKGILKKVVSEDKKEVKEVKNVEEIKKETTTTNDKSMLGITYAYFGKLLKQEVEETNEDEMFKKLKDLKYIVDSYYKKEQEKKEMKKRSEEFFGKPSQEIQDEEDPFAEFF